jgi:ribosomal-protein-alanine N-acetyltransferase
MTDFAIRRMQLSDIDAVMAIAESLDTAPHWPRSAYETALNPAATPQRVALVAELSGQIIGFTIASLLPPQAELESIAVSKSQQGYAGGKGLFAALLRELESRQVTEITLEVRSSNETARAFYRSQSLQTCSERKGYYTDTGEGAIIMRRILSSK